MNSCSVNTSTRKIELKGGFTATVTAGSQVKIIIGLIKNPANQLSTDSFKLVSYTDSTYTYTIDQIQNGLIPNFACNYPCKTCTTSKSTCTSCFTSVSQKYLSNNQCLDKCPAGTYADSNYVCQACPS